MHARRCISGTVLAALTVLASARAAVAVIPGGERSLVIGPGWALVRERQEWRLLEGEQEVVLGDVPAGADLSTLVIRSARVPLQLLGWEREGAAAAGPSDGFQVSGDGRSVSWHRGAGTGGSAACAAAGSGPVRCRVSSPISSDALGVDISYVIRGFDWSAHYQIVLRGEAFEEAAPASMDLDGWVRIHNPCARAFDRVHIRLVGNPRPPAQGGAPDAGFLMLDDDSALSDLWRERVPEPETEFEYEMAGPFGLPAQADTALPLVTASRACVQRTYTLLSEDFPLDPHGSFLPLRKTIVFANTEANRLGIPLPPGESQVYQGGLRNRLLQRAWLSRVPADSEVRIDLGPAEDVRGARRAEPPSEAVDGFFEQGFRLEIQNLLQQEIRLEVNERPPIELEWNVIRASRPYRHGATHLRFETEIKARSMESIEYRLRVRQPEL